MGEFQYEITGSVELPQLSVEVLKIGQSLQTNRRYSIDLPIPLKNESLIKAKKIIESIVERTEKKTSKTQQNLNNAEKYFPKISSSETYHVKLLPANEMVRLRSDNLYIRESEDKTNGEQQTVEPKVGL